MIRRKRQAKPREPARPHGQQGRHRDRLFCAAISVALEQGFAHVTMDAVARRAGISKGGLLYHFPSKTHLIKALLARYGEVTPSGAARPDPAGSGIDPMAVAVLIAAAENPSLIEPAAGREGRAPETSAAGRWRILTCALVDRLR